MAISAVLLVATVIVGFAAIQHRTVQRAAACERPHERWQMRLRELKEDGVIKITDTAYRPWEMTMLRRGEDEYELRACRTSEAGEKQCYIQRYTRRFGKNLTPYATE